jgi:hypothetical protein
MAIKTFSVQKTGKEILLFSVDSDTLNEGDIFFRRNPNGDIQSIQDIDDLDKRYVDSIIDGLSEGVEYEYNKLIKKENTMT